MNQVIETSKEFIVIGRESFNELEMLGKETLSDGQHSHDIKLIQKGKTILECVEWMKDRNIYGNDF